MIDVRVSILQNSQKKIDSNKKSETAMFWKSSLRIRCNFSHISLNKIELSTEKISFIFDKNLMELIFLQFLEYNEYSIYDDHNMSARYTL